MQIYALPVHGVIVLVKPYCSSVSLTTIDMLRIKNYALAQTFYDESLRIASSINHYTLIAEIKAAMGYLLIKNIGRSAEAEPYFQEATTLGVKLGLWRELAQSYRGYSMTGYYLGEYHQSLERSLKAEEYAALANEYSRLVNVLWDRVVVLTDLSQFELAEQTLQNARAVAAKHLTNRYIQRSNMRLGRLRLHQGDFNMALHEKELALQQYDDARSTLKTYLDYLASRPNSADVGAEVYADIGASFLNQGHLDSARVYYGRALDKATATGDNRKIGWYSIALAKIDVGQGEWGPGPGICTDGQ